MKKYSIITIILVFLCFAFLFSADKASEEATIKITNFEECVEAGNEVMESYPRQCRDDDELFVEIVDNVLEKRNLIQLDSPQSGAVINSPLKITGKARGYWFFEANFPISLTNWDGLIIAEGYASAKGDWMTEEFVPFEAVLEFEEQELYNRGTLILQKANASGLPEHDDALEIPVKFWEE